MSYSEVIAVRLATEGEGPVPVDVGLGLFDVAARRERHSFGLLLRAERERVGVALARPRGGQRRDRRLAGDRRTGRQLARPQGRVFVLPLPIVPTLLADLQLVLCGENVRRGFVEGRASDEDHLEGAALVVGDGRRSTRYGLSDALPDVGRLGGGERAERESRLLLHLRGDLAEDGARVVGHLVPALVHLDAAAEHLALEPLAVAHHLEERERPAEVAPQLEHLLVRGLVVLAVLARLHLLRAPPERDVRVGARRRAAVLVSFYLRNQRTQLQFNNQSQ